MKALARSLGTALLGVWLSGCAIGDFFSTSDEEKPPAALVDFEPRAKIETIWSVNVGTGKGGQAVKLQPSVDQGQVFVADREGVVKALEASNGKVIWTVKTDLPLSAGPGLGEGLVLLGTSAAEVVALDRQTGEQQWRAQVTSEVLSVPRVGEGIVVVQTIDGKVVGLDIGNGGRAWVYERPVPVLTLRGNSSPVIDNRRVICGFASGKLVALELTTGKLLWEVSITAPSGRTELERMVDIDGDPLLGPEAVYASTFQGDLAAIARDTGVVLWRRKVSSYKGIGADWRYIYVTDADDFVWAFDPFNGSAVWKQKKLERRRLSAPATMEDLILVGDFKGYLHWLYQEDGSMVARTRIGSEAISARPEVVDDTVYVYSDDGQLTALRPVPEVIDAASSGTEQ